ncbi:MAG: DUF2608 domain-containing protein [Alphaproteobacteria bacterium]|nr:DUF2608 domain-containing protein [Alphaproteobacteria bacterium]
MLRPLTAVWYALLTCCCCVGASENSFIHAINGDEVRAAFKGILSDASPRASKKFIAFFDCDDVSHKNIDASLQKKCILNFLKDLTIDKSVLPEVFKKICQDSSKEVVSSVILQLVSELQSFGYVFCLTQCTSDEATRRYRIATLRHLGYSFGATLPAAPTVSFDIPGLKPRFLQSKVTPPVYDSGIIFAGSASKGDTLKAFLKWLYGRPDVNLAPIGEITVALVDDARRNIDVVADACKELGVKHFIGVHYTEVEQPTALIPVLSAVRQVQKDALENCKVWLPDADAKYVALLQISPHQIPFAFGASEYILDCSAFPPHLTKRG